MECGIDRPAEVRKAQRKYRSAKRRKLKKLMDVFTLDFDSKPPIIVAKCSGRYGMYVPSVV